MLLTTLVDVTHELEELVTWHGGVLGGEGDGKGQRVFREREAEGSGAIVDGTEQISLVFIGHVNSQENGSQRGSIVTSAANRRREARAAVC